MFSHVVVGADNLEQAKTFYDAIFSVSGCDQQGYDRFNRPFYAKDHQRFIITRPINGQPASSANGGTIGLILPDAESVYRWHQQGVSHGGTSIETPPHIRADGKCVAYLRDPSGNKLCAVYTPPVSD